MLTFRAGAAAGSKPAASMANYLIEVREISERVGLTQYYAQKTGMARADIDPRIAELLGVPTDRPVTHDELAHLLSRRRTDGEAIPGDASQKSTENKARIAYYDLTFSAPKHLSIAIAFAPTEQERAALDRAHTDAVASAMSYIETQVAHARRGEG